MGIVAIPFSFVGYDIPGTGHPWVWGRTNPDDAGVYTYDQWLLAEPETRNWVEKWKAKCVLQNGDWVRRR